MLMPPTKLQSISTNHLSVTCWCRRHVLIPVAYLIEQQGGHHSVDDILKTLRCAQCGARGFIESCQIVYKGNSEFAMTGAKQGSGGGDAPKEDQ
jgi:hypothetical protein